MPHGGWRHDSVVKSTDCALGEDQDSGLSTLMGSYSGRGPCALFWHLGTLHACHKLM